MTLHYVSIEGLGPEDLAYFGLHFVTENDDFVSYVRGYDEILIVDKKSPHIYVDDINDAQHISGRVIMLQKHNE